MTVLYVCQKLEDGLLVPTTWRRVEGNCSFPFGEESEVIAISVGYLDDILEKLSEISPDVVYDRGNCPEFTNRLMQLLNELRLLERIEYIWDPDGHEILKTETRWRQLSSDLFAEREKPADQDGEESLRRSMN